MGNGRKLIIRVCPFLDYRRNLEGRCLTDELKLYGRVKMGLSERQEREREERKRQIREAALEVFSLKGYEAATMDEIAQRAELSKGVLYYYFSSKRRLYQELVLEITGKFYSEAVKITGGLSDFRDIISALLDFHINYFQKRLRELKLIFQEHFLGENLKEQLSELRKPLEEKIKSSAPAPWVFDLFWTYVLGLSAKMLQTRPIENIKREAETFKKMIKGEFQ